MQIIFQIYGEKILLIQLKILKIVNKNCSSDTIIPLCYLVVIICRCINHLLLRVAYRDQLGLEEAIECVKGSFAFYKVIYNFKVSVL